MGNLAQQSRYVCGLYNFQKFVGGIVFQPAHGGCSIKKSDTFIIQKINDFRETKRFIGFIHKMKFVTKENGSFNAPMVVDIIGIEKVKALGPTLARRRKTAEKKYAASLW